MATQHPDNASGAYFDGNKFISTKEELEECYRSFTDLDCDEYMFDWEGKFADSDLVNKLYRQYNEYFTKNPLGGKKRLTMRIPNKWEGADYSLPQAFMSILSSKDFVSSLKIKEDPIFEVILPMTKRADQLIEMRQAFRNLAKFKDKSFHFKDSQITDIQMIPLIEGTDDLCDCYDLLEEYLIKSKKEFGEAPSYLRPFIARSDPAMNAGLIPAVISAKAALSNFRRIKEKHQIESYPIIGSGSLPFRGGLNPYNLKEVLPQYKGIKTVTVQSSFRYDYPLETVKEAIKEIKATLPKMTADLLSAEEVQVIRELNGIFQKQYQATIEKIAPIINEIAASVPSRRERILHIGLLGYGRGVGKVKLPRAIKFTSAMYSIGVPPEFIGSGRGLKEARDKGYLNFILELFPTLKHELTHAGKYLNQENLAILAKDNSAFTKVQEDIKLIQEILQIELGPIKDKHFIHQHLTSIIYRKWKMGADFLADLEEAAVMRRSLG